MDLFFICCCFGYFFFRLVLLLFSVNFTNIFTCLGVLQFLELFSFCGDFRCLLSHFWYSTVY